MQNKKLTRKEKSMLPKNPQAVQATKDVEVKSMPWLMISAVVVAFLCYANTLGHGFVLDDYAAILENKSTQKGIGALYEFFTTSYRYGYIFAADELYRPLAKAMFALQWSISPGNASVGHWMNVLFFCGTVALLFQLVRDWTKGNTTIAWITAVLFAVLPIHTEVVANIKSLDEILGMFFGVLALKFSHQYVLSGKKRHLIATAFSFLFSLFSKESSVTLIAIMPLAAWYFTDEIKMRRWLPAIASFFSLLFFMALRSKAIGPTGAAFIPSSVDNMLVSADWLTKKTTAIYILGKYVWTILVGFPLSFDNSYPQIPFVGIASPLFIISAIVLIALFAFSLKNFKKKNVVSFALLYFFITVSLASNIFLLIGTHWGERLMYLPGLGIVFAMAILIERLSAKLKEESAQRQKVAMMITGVFVLIYGGMTVARNPIWKSNETVFRSGLVSAPNSTRVQYYLGNFYEKEDYLAGKDSLTQDSILRVAEGYLHRSLELSPKFIDAWNQLGLIYYHKRKLPQAIDTYLKGIATGTADATIYNNLGTAYFVSGQFPLAFEAFSTAVQMNPNYSDALCNLGSVYGRAGKYDLAISNFERCLQLDPRNKTALYFLGITYRSKGNEALAQQFINASENIK